MTHIERFIATIERKPVDRPATWLGEPVAEAIPSLLRYFGVQNLMELKQHLGDDVYEINIPYESPVSNHVAAAFRFDKDQGTSSYEKRSLTVPGFFEGRRDPEEIDLFDWPDPSLYIDPERCRTLVDAQPTDSATMVLAWSAHFQDACSAFGMEDALVTMMTNPDMFQAVIDRITDFYLVANEIFYESTKGRLDAVLIGNDFGTQTSLLLDPELIRRHVFPGTKKLIDQAHNYHLKVIHHSCGSIFPIIPDLIELGADAIHPIQALAADMSAEHLAQTYGSTASFCGGVDAQHLLVHGTPEAVRTRVQELKNAYPTGLIISPSHEAILPDTKADNIKAMFQAATDLS